MTRTDFLVVAATREEARYVPEGLPLLVTGLGKVAAASSMAGWLGAATPLPPGFREQVWSRIARTQRREPLSISLLITHWIGTLLPRPALAVSYVSILLIVGLTAGWAQGRKENARLKAELGDRYVHVLDPYQAARP